MVEEPSGHGRRWRSAANGKVEGMAVGAWSGVAKGGLRWECGVKGSGGGVKGSGGTRWRAAAACCRGWLWQR
jgi:hypothetical protein